LHDSHSHLERADGVPAGPAWHDEARLNDLLLQNAIEGRRAAERLRGIDRPTFRAHGPASRLSVSRGPG
jgi:hypothetical protein